MFGTRKPPKRRRCSEMPTPVEFPEVHRFHIPEGCHWRDIRETPANIGAALARAMREIERTNPDTLYRVFGASDWGNRELLGDATLKDLIEGLSEVALGNKSVDSDILGDAYEYLIANRSARGGRSATARAGKRWVVALNCSADAILSCRCSISLHVRNSFGIIVQQETSP